MEKLKTTESATVTNYPYGSLKCTATFSTEFKTGKGFRTVFQTINPKNGRVNNPKKSTYYPVIVLTKEEDGFCKYLHFGLNGSEEMNRTAIFLAENFDLFTPEQIVDICCGFVSYLRAEMMAICHYGGANMEQVKPLILPSLQAAIKGFKEGANVFADIKIDYAALTACKVPDYSPFKVTTGPIRLSEL